MTANPENTLQQLGRVHYHRTSLQAVLRQRMRPVAGEFCQPAPGNAIDPSSLRHCRDQLLRHAAEEHRLRERLWYKALHRGCLPAYRWQLRASLGDGDALFSLPDQPCLLGRDNRCDLVLPLPEISRCHADLRPEPDGVAVRDLQSTNGIVVNGQRVQAAVLRAGDRLKLGTVDFVLEDCQPADVVFIA